MLAPYIPGYSPMALEIKIQIESGVLFFILFILFFFHLKY